MKKSMILTLALVFVLGIAGTAFAANPFVDVPAKHWAYDAVAKLAQAGIVDGYGDGTFKGDKTMTRYEMAQIVAKSMARADKANAEQKAMIDKLSVEFSTELNNMGVRVAALEKKAAADRIDFGGQFRVRYLNETKNSLGTNHTLQGLLQINGSAKINDEWTANMRWEAYKDFRNDMGQQGTSNSAYGANKSATAYNGQYDIVRAYVTGPIMPGVKLTAGKYEETFGTSILMDDAVTGGKLEFGNQLKVKLAAVDASSYTTANKTSAATSGAGVYWRSYSKAYLAQLNYNFSKATSAVTSYQRWMAQDSSVANRNVWDLGLKSKLNQDWTTYGGYLKTNDNADNKAWFVGLQYGNADVNKVGSWAAFVNYEDLQANTVLSAPAGNFQTWMAGGEKGPVVGFQYIPAKNVSWEAVYYDATAYANNQLTSSTTPLAKDQHHKWFRTQVKFFF